MNRNLVFVYGTLKRGFCRHELIREQEFVAETTTLPFFRMYNCGDYPGMVPVEENGARIAGEVWAVDRECLEEMDSVEGLLEGLYRREPIKVDLNAGKPIWAYLYNRSVQDLEECGWKWVKGEKTD